jgi:DNA-binding PadR family transcriptional regulator
MRSQAHTERPRAAHYGAPKSDPPDEQPPTGLKASAIETTGKNHGRLLSRLPSPAPGQSEHRWHVRLPTDFTVYNGPSKVVCQVRRGMMECLNATAGALLGLLRNGPRSGYDLVAEAEVVIGGFWTITRSQVYRELADLADRGLLKRGQVGPRDRQPFALTSKGQAAFGEWVNTAPEPENLRIPLLLRLTFADAIEPGRLRETISRHRAVHAQRLERYRSLDRELKSGGVPDDQRVTLAYGISYEIAVLGWFDQLPASMSPPE